MSPRRELDAIEQRIIALLQEDGRMSTQALAREAGCSEVTARRRLRGLLDDGTVQIVAAVDPFRIGYESPVIIGLKVDRRKLDEVADQLAEHPWVRYIGVATGNDDLIVEVVAPSNHDLTDFLLEYLAKIDGVLDTRASLIMRIYKQAWKWGVKEINDA